MDRRYVLITFGCQMNFHDAERISGLLHSAGWREARSPEESDAVILLTCCVRESAERRLYGRLGALKPLKERKGTLIAVGGCLAQKEGVRLLVKAPYIDLVFGTHRYTDIARLLEESLQGNVCDVEMSGLRTVGLPRKPVNKYRGWVAISQGCDNYCTYCIVPYVRGPEESRPMREVIEEVDMLVGGGCREIVLLGQNVNSYRRKEEGNSAFAALLRELGSRFPDTWIRFTTSHPRDFDSEIIEAVAETEPVCENVHLPLQAGSDAVLERMNRGYTADNYLAAISELRQRVSGLSLTTDLIVGFPGERERDFRATLEMVKECRFDASYTFLFNPREGTAAANLPDDVPARVKQDRLNRLMQLTRRLTRSSLEGELGRDHLVLVQGPSRKDKGMWAARTRNNKLVHFPRGDEDLEGRLARVRIASAGSWSLHAGLLEVVG